MIVLFLGYGVPAGPTSCGRLRSSARTSIRSVLRIAQAFFRIWSEMTGTFRNASSGPVPQRQWRHQAR
jgi:hypothetical protein